MICVRIFDHKSHEEQLGTLLGKGGEGEVYALVRRQDVAIKLYHDEVLLAHRDRLQAKIEAQIQLYPTLKHLPLAWPRLSVFDAQQRWIGYGMSRAQGVPIRSLAHPALQKKNFPLLQRTHICNYLIQLLKVIHELHQHGVVLGDINLGNMLLDPADTTGLWLIDCDSMQITDTKGKRYPCLVGTPEFSAPEHQDKPFAQVVRTPYSDAYSLTILIFQCFMLGRHPFDQIGGEGPVQNMRSGHFPYGKTGIRPGSSGGIPPGPWYLMWSWLSYKLKDAFFTTFRAGSQNPEQRTSLPVWIKYLEEYQYAISSPRFGLVDDLRPAAPKPSHGDQQLSVLGATSSVSQC